MKFAALIIGDEILSGRRADKHLAKVIELLNARGLQLSWARYCGDDFDQLTAILRETFASGNVVFSFGGIGATPDDRTRQAAAAALGLELALHPEAEQEIRARFGADITPQRLQMGVYPQGSAIIPNPFNRIPGFAIQQHYFAPGFPVMAWPMVEWLRDTHYAHLHHRADHVELAVNIQGANEGQFIELMQRILDDWPGINVFSLPTIPAPGEPYSLELGVKGSKAAAHAALALIETELRQRGLSYQPAG